MLHNGFYSLIILLVIGFLFYLSRQIQDEAPLHLYSTCGAIRYIIKNLQAPPINDLKLVSIGQDCPDYYEEEPIGSFSGTVEACWNPTTRTYSQLNACTRHSIEITISEINATSLFNWRSHKFCSQRLQDSYIEKNDCAASYRKCGSLLCVPKDELCPVSFISISKDSKGRVTEFRTENDESSDTHLLFLDISLNTIPCISDLLWPLASTMNSTLPLIRNPVGCEVTDLNSEELDAMTGSTFLAQYPDLKKNISQVPLVGDILSSERIVLASRNRLSIKSNSNIDFCMSLAKQDPKTLETPLFTLETIYINFKWHAFWFLALGTGTALFTIFANHVLKYIAAFSTTLILYSLAVAWQLWKLSETRQGFKDEMTLLQQIGSLECFENDLLNEFMFRRFSEIWELSSSLQESMGELLWVSLAFGGLSLGLVYWVWSRRKSVPPEVVVYNRGSF